MGYKYPIAMFCLLVGALIGFLFRGYFPATDGIYANWNPREILVSMLIGGAIGGVFGLVVDLIVMSVRKIRHNS